MEWGGRFGNAVNCRQNHDFHSRNFIMTSRHDSYIMLQGVFMRLILRLTHDSRALVGRVRPTSRLHHHGFMRFYAA